MYSSKDRNTYFVNAIKQLESFNLVEGIIQLGSGVIGYKDLHSDIDLMVATSRVEDVEQTKNLIHQTLSGFDPLYIKEKQLRQNIFLLIAIKENKLEFNVSVVPRELLSVKSPLWKVIVDKTGLITEKMNAEHEHFLSKPVKYNLNIDIAFEFVYCAMALEKELKRNNVIYALKMLEEMRDYTLIVQALNEDKKLHQFKAYETLDPAFIKAFLSTYPKEVTVENLLVSAEITKGLFSETLKQSTIFTIDHSLEKLLNQSLVL
ncbi:aminoglycoside 6-adenylyltransferase [Fredinandcohnia humi]